MVWQGENTATGSGVLVSGGSVAAGTTATFDNFTGGAGLQFGSMAPATGATLTLNLTGSSAATLTSGAQLGGAGTVVNQGNLMLTGGGVGGQLTNQGAMSISGTGNPTIGYCTDYNSGAVAQGTVTNAGTITHAAGTTLGIGNGSTINNLAGAVYDIQSNAQISGFSYASWPAWPFSAYSSGGAINNAGLFIKSGTGTASVSNTYFNNTGTVEVDGGILSIGMGTSTNGSYVFSNGGQAQVSVVWQGENTATGSGVLVSGGSVAAGTTATFDNFTGGASLQFSSMTTAASGTLNLNLSSSNPANLAGGSLGGNGTTLNLGSFLWTNGYISGTGGLTNQSSQFTISGNGGQELNGTLTNSGTITETTSGVLTMYGNGATLNNLAGAVYNLQGNAQIQQGYSYSTINNAGLFLKSSGTGTAYISPNFNNTGTVEVDNGTLSIGMGTSTNGSYVFSNGGQAQVSVVWQGENTATGSGVLVSGGSVAAGTTATFDNFTGGASLQFSSMTTAASGTLNLNLSSSNPANLAGGSLGGNGTTLNLGSFLWTNGYISGTGGLTNQSSQFTISGNGGQELNGTLTNSGTITETTSGVLTMYGNGATLNNLAGAVYNLQGNAQIQQGYSYSTINNAGLFLKSSGTGTAYISPNFNNTGTVEVDNGTLSIGSGTSTNGRYVFSNGGQAQVYAVWQGENTASGSGTLNAGGSVAAGTTATFDNFTGGASLQFSSMTTAASGTLNLNLSSSNPANLAGGSLGGNGTTLNLGSFLWTNGYISGTGGLTNQSSQFTISGNGGQELNGTLTNSGTITETTSGVLTMYGNGATLNNLAGAVYNLQGNAQIQQGYSYSTINNAGLFLKSSGTGTAYISPNFNNTGTVEVDAGTLQLNGSITQFSGTTLIGGTWVARTNSALSIPSGGISPQTKALSRWTAPGQLLAT